MHANLRFRFDYAHSLEGLSELAKLIDDVFGVDITSLNRLGHDPSVIAYGWWNDGELVANVSLYERTLWLVGEQTKAFGVQSVAVRPDWRGKGLFRDLLTRALDYADAHVGLVILATGTPDLYRRFGFRQVQETCFKGVVQARPGLPNFRQLKLDENSDLALLRNLFARRVPTSSIAAACDHPALFMLKAVETPAIKLMHLPDFDAVIAVQDIDDTSMTLLDIVAPSIPSLEEIASALGYKGRQVRVLLTPDELSWTPQECDPIDTGCMVRGSYAAEGQKFMLSDMRI